MSLNNLETTRFTYNHFEFCFPCNVLVQVVGGGWLTLLTPQKFVLGGEAMDLVKFRAAGVITRHDVWLDFGRLIHWPDDPDRQLDVVPTPPEAAEFVIKFVITCWAAIFEFYLSNLCTVAVPDTTVRSFFNMLWETAEWPMPYYNMDSDFMDTLWQ